MGTPEAVSPMTWQRSAIRDPQLTSSPAVAVVASLVTLAPGRARSADPHGWDFFASVPTLAKLSRLSERAVRGALADLRTAGYLFQVKRGGNRNTGSPEASTWRLTAPSEAAHDACSLPVDNPDSEALERGVNRHGLASEPAPDDSPRAEFYQGPYHHPSSAYGTDRAREPSGDDAAEDVHTVDTIHGRAAKVIPEVSPQDRTGCAEAASERPRTDTTLSDTLHSVEGVHPLRSRHEIRREAVGE